MTCEVIRDLLPLCADGVASEETEALVRAHIRGCPSCEALYKKMCRPMEPEVTLEELDYMAAVERQKKENRRFVLRVYGIALGIALFFGAIWFVDQMFRYESWMYDTVTVSREEVEKKMPQTLLTREEKDLAKVIFSLPEVQEAFAILPEEGGADLPEEVYHYLLTQVGVEPDSLHSGYATIFDRIVILDYYNDEYRCILEFIDADRSGYTDILRKHATKNIPKLDETGTFLDTSNKEPSYIAQINAAMIGLSDTGNAEENEQTEEFYTTYEKISGKRQWLDFLKRDE